MPKIPYFSIITVSRNHETGLKRTGESIKTQQFQDLEWVVVDGASADGSVDYIRSTNAAWSSEPDTGIYDAMNKGMARARGDYLLFLNAGDMLAAPDTLQKIAGLAHNKNPDFIYGDSFEESAAGKIFKPARPHRLSHLGMFTHHQAMLYRREAVGDLRYNQAYPISADYDFTRRFLIRNRDVLYCRLPVCVFEGGGVSQQKAQEGRKEQYDIRKKTRAVSGLENIMIYGVQSLAWIIRTRAPGVYWKLKSRSSGNSGSGSVRT